MKKSNAFILSALLLISGQMHAGIFSIIARLPISICKFPISFVTYIGSFLHTQSSINKIITQEFKLMQNAAEDAQNKTMKKIHDLKQKANQIDHKIISFNNKLGNHERLQNFKHAEFMRQMCEIEHELDNEQKKLSEREVKIRDEVNSLNSKSQTLAIEKTELESRLMTQDKLISDKINNLSATMDNVQKQCDALKEESDVIAYQSTKLAKTLEKCKKNMNQICSVIALTESPFLYLKQNEIKDKKKVDIGRSLDVLVKQQQRNMKWPTNMNFGKTSHGLLTPR